MRTVSSLLILFYALSISSQGYKISEFKQSLSDGSAFHAPLDSLGHPCGLIKVRTENPELHFNGSIVGTVENNLNEYWVYLASGSKQMKIIHPNFLPFYVDFNLYGIEKIDSKVTYVLVLRETNFKKEKCGLTLTVKPNNAKVIIDGNEIDNLSGDGFYQLYLPKGDHICRVTHNGYRPQTQIISSGKMSKEWDVALESVMANMQINCKTRTAEIIVDGESKGNGSWNGDVEPGSHHIEARQSNYEPQRLDISLEEKENRTISIPELKRLKGKLKIQTTPTRLPVMLDGEFIGTSPCEIETETGEHYVSCNAFGCLPYRTNIEVGTQGVNIAKIKLEYDLSKFDLYPEAYQGDVYAMKILANNNMFCPIGSSSGIEEEAIFWRERIEEIDRNYYIKNANENDTDWWIMTYEISAERYEEKGEQEKALNCYKKIINILTTEWKTELFGEYRHKNFKQKIFAKIKELETKAK